MPAIMPPKHQADSPDSPEDTGHYLSRPIYSVQFPLGLTDFAAEEFDTTGG